MLYCLYHNNIVSENGFPDHECRKIIGHYDSLERALSTMKRYESIEGFAEFPYGFGVELICRQDLGEAADCGIVYRNAYVDCGALDGIETYFEGYYVSLEQAKTALQELKALPRFSNVPENLDVYEICINRDQWTEGFATE